MFKVSYVNFNFNPPPGQANPKDIEQLHSAIEHRLREVSKKVKVDNDGRSPSDGDEAKEANGGGTAEASAESEIV